MTAAFQSSDRAGHSIAQTYLRDEPAFVSSLDFGPFVSQGVGSGPCVLIGDQSEIPLLHSAVDTRLDHRMALLARNGDSVLVRHREPGFENYLSQALGLKNVEFVEVNGDPHLSVTRLARRNSPLLDKLAHKARDAGGLTLKAYLTTGNVWRLAQAIGERSGQRIHVCGPSPRMTKRVNDKLWFSQLAREVIGTDATPPTRSAFGPAAAAGLVRQISRTAEQVVVKVPDSAGSAGNIRLERAQLRGLPLAALRQFLLQRLHAIGWHDHYPILVGVWDAHVSHSPSVQLWLPDVAEGDPQVEGIFEQRVEGGAAAFAGASHSALPASIKEQLSSEAIDIARVLQRLGYFGRCSFDAVICANSNAGSGMIHWIECNGRWGGVSIPMTATSQLVGKSARLSISILQEVLPGIPMSSDALKGRLADLLFRHGRTAKGLIILSPPEREAGVSVNLLAVAEDQDAADALLAEAMRRLASS